VEIIEESPYSIGISGGQVCSCQRTASRTPPFGFGGARASDHTELTKILRTIRAYSHFTTKLPDSCERLWNLLSSMTQARSQWVPFAGNNRIKIPEADKDWKGRTKVEHARNVDGPLRRAELLGVPGIPARQ